MAAERQLHLWFITCPASLNKASGKERGNGTTHTESMLTAGNNVTLKSGRDTTLTGAQVSGEKITASVGRNLTLTSEQDSNTYDSKQQSASAGGTFNIGSMSGSGSLSLSRVSRRPPRQYRGWLAEIWRRR